MIFRRLAMIAGLLYVVWFSSFIAMPAIVDAMIQSADSIGSHKRRLANLERSEVAR